MGIHILFFFFLSLFILREREKTSKGGVEREDRRSEVGSMLTEERAQLGAWAHKPGYHNLSWSQTLNWLSHPGTPHTPFHFDFSFSTYYLMSVLVKHLCEVRRHQGIALVLGHQSNMIPSEEWLTPSTGKPHRNLGRGADWSSSGENPVVTPKCSYTSQGKY